VPLGAASTVVRCEACGTSFEDAALALPTAQEQAVTALDALRAVAAALIALSARPAVTTAAAVRMLRDAGLPGYGDTDIAWDLQSRAGDRAIGTLSTIAPVLPLFDRERFLTRAATIGLADGTTTLEVLGYLHRVGTTLDLSKAHIDGVIGQVRSQTAS
jgi:hypothetical protein